MVSKSFIRWYDSLATKKNKHANRCCDSEAPSTSFPGSLILPPPEASAPGGGKMRDPGNEVEAQSNLRRRNLKTQQSPAILNLCLRKTRAGKSRDYRYVIIFKKLRFQNVFRPHENEKPAFSNSSCLKSVVKELRHSFRDGLVWTVGLTVEI